MLRQGTYALCFTSRSKHNIDSLQIRHLRRHYRTTFGGGVGGVGIGIGTSLHTLSRALSARLLHPRDPPNNHDNNSTNDHSNRAMITARSRQAFTLFLCGTAAFLSVSPYSTTTQAENIPYRSPLPQSQPEQAQPATTTTTHAKTLSEKVPPNCPSYGCPLYPQDVHYTNETIKKAFEKLRSTKRVEADHESVRIFHQSATSDSLSVTLTLIGYKGGQIHEQINQDRAVVVSPFYITDEDNDTYHETSETTAMWNSYLSMERTLLGVFDGHAPLGERISEYTATELPRLLASKLREAFGDCSNEQDEIAITSRALSETFIELDKTAPADPSGGCTASVIMKQGRKVYVANAGDSRSFIATYRPSTGLSEIVYISREDKPSLPDEKARVEAAGGQVYVPIRGTSRVVYNDPLTGAPTGLAMSRSIGDWAAGKLGVIPDPIVHVLDVDAVVASQLNAAPPKQASSLFDIDITGRMSSSGVAEDDVYVFAVSATDGIMDYISEDQIAGVLAHSLFSPSGVHPISACEHLIFAAAQAWHQAKQGRYRDDISIAISVLRRPRKGTLV